MKKLLEINLREDGLSIAECNLDSELDCKRLAAAFIAIACESSAFAYSLMDASNSLRDYGEEAKKLAELGKRSAAAKMFINQNTKNKS